MFNLFKRKKKIAEFDFTNIGIDMHSHILPGIDDGARTIEDSIALARRFEALNYKIWHNLWLTYRKKKNFI